MAKDSSSHRSVTKLILAIVITLVIIALLAGGAFYFMKYRRLSKRYDELSQENNKLSQQYQELKTNPDAVAQAEVQRYIDEVGKLYALPKDEKPSVATVKDKDKLKDQPFFAKAENGDVTLIYANAKLAILYRPSTKQLINVSSVTIQNNQTAQPQQ
jgi:hypothetical protein